MANSTGIGVAKAIEEFRNGGTKPKSTDAIRAQIAALQTELQAAEEAERKAAMVGDAKRATALLAAMRQAYKEIEDMFPGTFEGERWIAAAQPQAWPRDAKFRRAAALSETETENARQAGKDAVAGIKL